MNIDKVNEIMQRAIILFQQGEIDSLAQEGVELEGLEVPVAQMSKEIAEASGQPFDEVLDVVTSVLGEAAAKRFSAEGLTEEDAEGRLVEWMTSGGATPLAQQVVERLLEASDYGTLNDYRTGKVIRKATKKERDASKKAAKADGGAGVIKVDGQSVYVED